MFIGIKLLQCFQWFKIPDNEDYCSELKKEYTLSDVFEATWITTKNITSTPLLLTFKEKEPPRFIKIPGEQAKTKVYEYCERPTICKKCLKTWAHSEQERRVRDAVNKDTKKISAPVRKSNATNAKQTTKPYRETA